MIGCLAPSSNIYTRCIMATVSLNSPGDSRKTRQFVSLLSLDAYSREASYEAYSVRFVHLLIIMLVFVLNSCARNPLCSIMFLFTKISVGSGAWNARTALTLLSHNVLDHFPSTAP